jgi:hypothetical protein
VVYTPSVREYHYPEVPEYPFQDRTIEVTQCGRICIGRRKINLSTVFGGQYVGIREVADSIWLISFMDYDPGFFDEEHNTLGPVGENPLPPEFYISFQGLFKSTTYACMPCAFVTQMDSKCLNVT